MWRRAVHVAFLAAAAAAAAGEARASGLPSYNINPELVTVGGLSSGAFAAVQFHFAFSSEVKGAAVFAGGPFLCSGGSVDTALTTCASALPSGPDVSQLSQQARTAASGGLIDGVGNLTSARVYLYSGTGDTVVYPAVVSAAAQQYGGFVSSSSGAVVTDFDFDSEHCVPTLSYGEDCTSKGSPYLGKCDYDGAGKALAVLYPGLSPRGSAVSSNLLSFDQTQYGASAAISMGSKGFVYVPTACQSGSSCALHVNLHGCEQTVADIGSEYVDYAGFNEWAESNNIVVLYPQVAKSQSGPSNPYGCWDWWGYTDSNYAYRTGQQNVVVYRMVQALLGAAKGSA